MHNKKIAIAIKAALVMGLAGTAHASNIDGVSLQSGRFTYTGGLTLRNSTLNFRAPTDAAYGDMSVTGDFSGANSTIGMNTFFDAGGNTAAGAGSNRILINGNASGQTTLVVSNNGGPGASTDLNANTVNDASEGISLAQVSGTSSANVFSLQGEYVAVGAYQYRLYAYAPGQSDPNQRLVQADTDGHWDYRLQNAKASTAVTPPVAPPAGPSTPGPSPAPETRPGLVPQAPSYLLHNNALFAQGQQIIGSLHQRSGEIAGGHTATDGNIEAYVRALGSDRRYISDLSFSEFGYDYDQNMHGGQIGAAWLKPMEQGGSLRLGAVYSQTRADTKPRAVHGIERDLERAGQPLIEDSRERTRGKSAALTATWQAANGFYVDGVFGASQYESDVTTPFRAGRVARLESDGTFASIEVGHGFDVSEQVTIEPQAQVSWQKLETDAITDVDGVTVDLGTPEQFVWRVGGRATLASPESASGTVRTQYVKLNYYGSEGPDQRAFLSGDRFATGQFGRTAELGVGLTASLKRGMSFYGDIAWQDQVGSDAGRDGWGANLGMRWAF